VTPEAERIVKETWKAFEPRAAEFAPYFYAKLFEIDPESQGMFAKANMTEQQHRLMETIGQLVGKIDDTQAFVADLAALGRRHFMYGVRDSDYDSAGVALLWTLESAFGAEFTPEVRAAWTEAYQAMSSVMRRVATVVSGTHRVR
jgi:hemoglobin-like flavoprotein